MFIEDDPHASIKLIENKLKQLDYKVEKFSIRDKAHTRFTSPAGKSWITADAHISYPMTTGIIRHVSNHKDLAYEFVKRIGIPVPETLLIESSQDKSLKQLEVLLKKYKKLVVKPADLSLSKGLTTDIESKTQLKSAIQYALEYSPRVLIQQQVYGEEVRLVIINGRVHAALLRQTPRVTGDGIRTIKQLIEKENNDRKLINHSLVSYPQLEGDIVDKDYIAKF